MHSGATATLPPVSATASQKANSHRDCHLALVTDEMANEDSLLMKALKDLDAQPGEQLAERLQVVGEMLTSLAERHSRRGESARAEVLYLRAIQVFRTVLPSNHPIIALSRDNLASLYKARRQYTLAESLQRTALSDLQQYYRQPHADIAVTLCNLADTCMMTGRTQDARKLLDEGLAIFRQLFGEDDPRVEELNQHYSATIERFQPTCRAKIAR